MDSFVLSETFKYLYLLFAHPSDLIVDMDQFIFTTEAHLLPLSLARLSNLTVVPVSPLHFTSNSSETLMLHSLNEGYPLIHFLI